MQIEPARFGRLIDAVDACAPGYWAAHTLALGHADLAAALARGAPGLAPSAYAAASQAIFEQWAARGLRFASTGGAADPVAAALLDFASDTAAGMDDGAAPPDDIEAILAEHYAELRDAGGALMAYRRKRAGAPLLLLNAFGIPLRIWHKLLAGQHDYQLIVPALSNCDPVHGGMRDASTVSQLAQQLDSLLAHLALDQLTVLAWCNAGRLGLALLDLCPARIRHLLLLSPTLRGGPAAPEFQSPYENNLGKLFKLVSAVPKSAAASAAMLGQLPALPDWAAMADAQARAHLLFGLPRRAFSADLSRPMASAASLLHYAARTHADEALSATRTAPLPARPITLIQGEHDAVVNNAQARDWLQRHGARLEVFGVAGAGHTIQDLHFSCLGFILERVVHGAPEPFPARIRSH